MSEFEGFTPDFFTFLKELKANNDRDWFAENKPRYEELVREPTLAFVRAMDPKLESISEHFLADDRKSGGSMMRVYRDVRFSKDKSPYKTNVGVQFRHDAGKDVHAPGLYVHFEPGDLFIGVGLWRPPNPVLTKIRTKIVAEPDRWKTIITESPHAKTFHQTGESLKRPPRGFEKDHPLVEELKRKSFLSLTSFEPELMYSESFVDYVSEQFQLASGYVGFLCEAVELDF